MPQGECPGSCNAALRRARREYKKALADYDQALIDRAADPGLPEPERPEPPDQKPTLGEPVFCWRCTAMIRRELAELEDLAAPAQATADGYGAVPGGERVSGSPQGHSLSPSLDDLDELISVLRRWESVAVEGRTRPRRGFLALELTTVADQVLLHFDRLISMTGRQAPAIQDSPTWAQVFAYDIRQWHRRLTGATKAGTGRHQKTAIPCPRCDRYSLVWEEGGRLRPLPAARVWPAAVAGGVREGCRGVAPHPGRVDLRPRPAATAVRRVDAWPGRRRWRRRALRSSGTGFATVLRRRGWPTWPAGL